MKPILVSGIQPTGRLHLGNYLGALKNFVDLQNSGKYGCYFFIADLHALTENPTAKDLNVHIINLMADFLSIGLDPKKSIIFQQSQIEPLQELKWILSTLTPVSELLRMTAFKEKVVQALKPSEREKITKEKFEEVMEASNFGLAEYPVLMAADILIYDAKFVPVGNDQLQHLEFARTLARKDVNLLAGRALTSFMYPLTATELGADFTLRHALQYGHLPSTFQELDPRRYLTSYVTTYLREEVQQEGLTRNLGAFTRFLETASFSQAQLLNVSAVARECAVHRKVAEHYFSILYDLRIATQIPVFTKKAKRRMAAHPKFYFFDAGVYRAIRPQGPLDTPEDIDGAALETLVMQEITAMNHYRDDGYQVYFWRTAGGHEVDIILYGARGIVAIEVKRGARVAGDTLNGLSAFLREYPMARAYLLYGGDRASWEGNIRILPVEDVLRSPALVLENHSM